MVIFDFIRFKKLSFYQRVLMFVSLALGFGLCVTTIGDYHDQHRYPIDTEYLDKLYHLKWENAETMEANGFHLLGDVEPEADTYTYCLEDSSATPLRFDIVIGPSSRDDPDAYTHSMRVTYKNFWARLWNLPEPQEFLLIVRTPAYKITILDSYETEDYPERIYRQIDTLAELFPATS